MVKFALMAFLAAMSLQSQAQLSVKVFDNLNLTDTNIGYGAGFINAAGASQCALISLDAESESKFLDRIRTVAKIGSVRKGYDRNLYYAGLVQFDLKKQPTDVHVYLGAGVQDVIDNKDVNPFFANISICTENYFPKIPFLDIFMSLDVQLGKKKGSKGPGGHIGILIDLSSRDED